jgi:hypothetical protein
MSPRIQPARKREIPSRKFVPTTGNLDPWALVWGQPYIDADRLAAAIEADLQATPAPDFRTRLLIRDAGRALASFWGGQGFAVWLANSPVGERIKIILEEDLGKPGFGNIRRRLVSNPNLADIKHVLQLIGERIHGRIDVNIAGSIPTLIAGLTARPTNDIDIVNEVPAEIREQRAVLQKIDREFGLKFGHVQSHYLPSGWESRRQFLGDFGGLRVYLVDPYDIFVSKLSSKQEKHQQDLRVMAKTLDQKTIHERLFGAGKPFLEDPYLRPQIEKNWHSVYVEPLVTDQ